MWSGLKWSMVQCQPQLSLRGLAMYQLVQFAATAVSALFWGLFADQVGLVATYLVAAALLIIGAVASVVVLPLRNTSLDRTLVTYWPDPLLELDVEEHPGQILVTLTYRIAEQNREEFLSLAPSLRRMRRRTGGTSWHLYVDAADPRCYVEQFTVSSWEEHMIWALAPAAWVRMPRSPSPPKSRARTRKGCSAPRSRTRPVKMRSGSRSSG